MLSANADQLSLHMQAFESWQQRQEVNDGGEHVLLSSFLKKAVN